MPCFDWFFLASFLRKRDVFSWFFTRNWQKTSKNKQKYHPNQEKSWGCFATVLQLLQFISGLYTPILCVKIASFLIKLHCSGWFFSLFICVKIEFCRDFSREILCNLAKLSTKFRNRHRVFCYSATVHFEVIHIPFLSYLQIHIKISISSRGLSYRLIALVSRRR